MVQRIRGTGFTLFELLVVLILIGLITSLVGPRLFKTLNRRNIDSAARQIAAALRYARSQAVTEKNLYLANFDMDACQLTIKCYGLPEEEDLQNQTVRPYDKPRVYTLTPGIRFSQGQLISGKTIETGAFEIGFYPAGGTTGGKILLIDEKGRQYSIAVDMITGSVNIKQEGLTDG